MSGGRRSRAHGAIVLAAAGLFSQVLSAVYKIPLSRMIGDQGVGLYSMAYNIYAVMVNIATMGAPLAISKLTAEALAKGRQRDAAGVFRTALTLFAATGLAATALTATAAHWYAYHVSRDPRAFLSIIALAPAVILVALEACYRGLLQGEQDMIPSATSQVIEQVTRVASSFVFAYLLVRSDIGFASAGATSGAALGAIAGLLFLSFAARRPGRQVAAEEGRANWADAGRLMALTIPLSLVSIVLPLMGLVDNVIVPARLQAQGSSVAAATALFGQLAGMALPVVMMPAVITTGLTTTVVPNVAEAAALHRGDLINHRARTALRVALIVQLPATVGLMVLATPITQLLYELPAVGPTLFTLAPALLFLTIQQVTAAVMQGLGKTITPAVTLFAGAALKTVLTLLLTDRYGIRGAALATVAGFLLAAALNLWALRRVIGPFIEPGGMFIRPGFATAAMAAATAFAYRWLVAARSGNAAATFGAIALAIIVYLLALLAVRGLKREDVAIVPGPGAKLADVLARLGLVR